RAPAASPFTRPSPFEADRSRKSDPKAEAANYGAPSAAVVGAAVLDIPVSDSSPTYDKPSNGESRAAAIAVTPEVAVSQAEGEVTAEAARNAVLGALEDAGQQMLAHNLEEAEWSVRGVEVSAKVAMS